MKKLFIFFTAGCIGALANSLIVWQFGQLGISGMLGVSIAPSLSPAWLYPRIVWGGLWALLFILPLMRSRLLYKGLVLSLIPTAVQLFVVFPFKAGKGMAGLDLGMLTPLMVLFFNAVWGLVAALSIRAAR
ncbi:hypothetical protein NO559_04675 [Dasania sp. GY-MA-18]|uniref:Uncharacterized protein n=1 Tax=Dasania phycosphaerae TaxID=2950436 RepID=A0A9J6RJS5_9GAMM|nr:MULTISPECIES: hypothetical protein [Dasania]MCR8922052.1 hypothetical protein [Dasania sp. GY-MA-18]MCZ0864480.1 hypothetical protein [Dasania phycosphaerae]MCZ0868208.1 hypothetical protein [Dasania phycosphaerae]